MPRSLGRYTFSTLESKVSRFQIEANNLIFYGRGSTNEVVLMDIIVPTLGRLLLIRTSTVNNRCLETRTHSRVQPF